MATIGHKHAVADAFGLKLTGLPAYVMWGLVHVAYLIDWGNRLGTLYAWSRALYAINNRGNRVITFHQASDELGQGRIRAVQPAPEVSASQEALGRSAPLPVRVTGPGQPDPGQPSEWLGRNGPTSA
jgi:NADH:ubiquinone reductase (H+-translocating)